MATKKELLEQSQKAIADYIGLSKYLFSEEAPLDVNEIPKENPFYDDVKAISDEMELNWNEMSHEDSNRVMLNILAEYYSRILSDDKYTPVLTITFKPKE